MLVTLTNGMQLIASRIHIGCNINVETKIYFTSMSDIVSYPNDGIEKSEYYLRLSATIELDADVLRMFIFVDQDRIESITSGDGSRPCPYNEPLHDHHDGCPSCDVDGAGDLCTSSCLVCDGSLDDETQAGVDLAISNVLGGDDE